MWSSTNACGAGSGARARAEVADARQLLTNDRTVDAANVVRLLERQSPDIDEAAHHVGREAGTLLVGEEPDRQRAGELEPGGLDRLDHLQPGEHAEVAVVAAPRRHRVDVRPGHDRRLSDRVGHLPDHVADRVDRDLEAQIAHPRDHEVAARPVLVGERQPGTALRVGDRADARQLVETVDQAATVDAQRRPIRHGATVPTFYKSSNDTR